MKASMAVPCVMVVLIGRSVIPREVGQTPENPDYIDGYPACLALFDYVYLGETLTARHSAVIAPRRRHPPRRRQ